ncbi:unnamed protein product [Larinioides sclopetarius]|uniref:Uncharacterized protein n=1 Tax=Larinioides sclopetarius TaxID=280406 RepID=A0AAV1Z140_9ARAC
MDNSTDATADVVDACPKRVREIKVQNKGCVPDNNGPDFSEMPPFSSCDGKARQRNGTEISENNVDKI